jgi:prepilin-type N-terminal cleavage/methylation domain-containing protein
MIRQIISALRNNRKGFTLVEMMIAMVIIMVGLLGLVQAALLTIDSNMKNLLRDEAVRISEQALTGELIEPIELGGTKHEGLKNLPVGNDTLPNGTWPSFIVARDFGGALNKQYTVSITVIDLTPDTSQKTKRLQVVVGWDHKKETPPKPETGREFQHSITSIVVSAL